MKRLIYLSFGLLLFGFLLLESSGCFTSPYFKGLPCEDDDDCFQLDCLGPENGPRYCGGGIAPQETTTEPKAEPQTEPQTEPIPEPDAGPIDTGCKEGDTKPCYTGPNGTQDVGTCQAGVSTCTNQTWGKCTNDIQPTTEICDNKDNDCDGQTDEELKRTCYSGTPGTQGTGICQEGEQLCELGQWGTCQGQKIPLGSDVCNGKDDDCDGAIDEDFPDKGKACSIAPHTGCQAEGSLQCNANNSALECAPKTPEDSTQCDGLDNDCDGLVDEECTCTDGQTQDCYTGNKGCVPDGQGKLKCNGICQGATQTCKGGKWEQTCTNNKYPQNEVCNFLDNNCDGKLDEPNGCLVKEVGRKCRDTNGFNDPCPTGYTCASQPGDRVNSFCFPALCQLNPNNQQYDDPSKCPVRPDGTKPICLLLTGSGLCAFICNASAGDTTCPPKQTCQRNNWCLQPTSP